MFSTFRRAKDHKDGLDNVCVQKSLPKSTDVFRRDVMCRFMWFRVTLPVTLPRSEVQLVMMGNGEENFGLQTKR